MSKNVDKICSFCAKEDITVDRDIFDGLCGRCTDKALDSPQVYDYARKANNRLKSGYSPYMCWCESTSNMHMCEEETCDGTFFWVKD